MARKDRYVMRSYDVAELVLERHAFPEAAIRRLRTSSVCSTPSVDMK